MEKDCDLKCYFNSNCGIVIKSIKSIEKEVYLCKADPLSLRWVQLDLHQVPRNAQRTSETLNDTPSLTMALGI